MAKFTKIFSSASKIIIIIFSLLFVILFFYSAFFYKPKTFIENSEINQIEEETVDDLIQQEEEKLKQTEIQTQVNEPIESTQINNIPKIIEDGLYATVGNKVITKSDILNEIKRILILNNMAYTEDKKDVLQKMAVQSAIKRSIKEIEVERNENLNFYKEDLQNELIRIANNININVENLKKICETNDLDFKVIEDRIKTDLMWNSLIFAIYRNQININLDEIDEQLKLNINKEDTYEYLISEIVINNVEKSEFVSTIENLKIKINDEGFENVAMNLSIAQTAINGGDLGWLSENKINSNFLNIITKTPVGELTPPIRLKDGILIFKIREKRKQEKEKNLEKLKNQLVNIEKTKMLNMYSESHYDNLRRSVQLKFFNE